VRLELKTAPKVYALEAAWILVGRAGIEPTTNGLKVFNSLKIDYL
jgi:hypothetical protein